MGARTAAVALALALALMPLSACRDAGVAAPRDVRAVSLGVSKESMSALAYVARDEGLFADNGLDVEFIEYSSAQLAFDAVRSGEIDAALCADTPIAAGALEGRPVRIVCTVASDSNDLKIVARSDAGISSAADLRGTRIGTRRGTAAHFFLHSVLIKHGMADTDVTMVFDGFEEVTEALIAGELDAVSLRQPFIAQLEDALGDRFVLIEEPGLYEKTMNLCVPVEGGPDAVVLERLVASFLEAEALGQDDTTGHLKRDVAAGIGVQVEDLCECLFSPNAVALRQSLILTLEDQARWALRGGLVANGQMPDFLSLVDVSPLEALDPDRVTVIR